MRTCPADHAHGANLTCYITHRCGCDECVRTASLYRRRRALRLADPDAPPTFVPTEEVALHVARLMDAGSTIAGIAAAADVPRSLLERIRDNRAWGKRGTRFAAASRILALRPTDSPAVTEAQLVPARGLQRRVQALMVDGWPLRAIAQAAGVEYNSLRASLYRPRVRRGTVHRIDAIYRHPRKMLTEHAGIVSAAVKARTSRAAQRRGYLPALVWHDIDTDTAPMAPDPELDDVDDVAVELAARGHAIPLMDRERTALRRRRAQLVRRRAA